jgi:hypothetical protein
MSENENTQNNEVQQGENTEAQTQSDPTQGNDIPAEANLPGQQEGFQGQKAEENAQQGETEGQ